MARRTHLFVQRLHVPAAEFNLSWADETQWQPRVDVYQTDEEFLLHVEAAGVREQDLQLHFEDGRLVVEGRRERPDLPCPQHCLQVEISYGAFRRVIALPREIDSESITASFSNGLLQIVVPRRKSSVQNIQINSA